MNATEKNSSFPVVVSISLWIRDPLFIAKNAITISTVIFEVSADITYLVLESAINKTIEEERNGAWKFVDWKQYSILPIQIRSRSSQTGGHRPSEQVLSNDEDVKYFLSLIDSSLSGSADHLAVVVTMYEGDQPPPEDSVYTEDGGVNIAVYQNDECEVCGREHGIGECRAASGGIRLEALGDENGGWGDEGEDEAPNYEPSEDDEQVHNWEPEEEHGKSVVVESRSATWGDVEASGW